MEPHAGSRRPCSPCASPASAALRDCSTLRPMPVGPSEEEEKYFRIVDAETRRKLRDTLEDNAKALEVAGTIAAAIATDDKAIAEQIRKLGFDGETARVFDLLPL